MSAKRAVPLVAVIDDDPTIRDALALFLDLEGFRVRTFETGEAFLTVLDRLKPDCILVDVHMPGKSGFDVLEALKDRLHSLPVFMLSGQGDIPIAVRAIKQGALDFIEKPFDGEKVVDRIREALAAVACEPAERPKITDDFPGAKTLTSREWQVLRRVASGGTALWMQISHPGRQCTRIVSSKPVSPSAVQLELG